ncbi:MULTISPECIES: hypothetical protein [Pseudomonas]|uniref:Uncharacterized protein n=1 Tax=Pseudomonas extremaustralis TaxID=359110 RepID=A0A5C5Q936_9PSED|nr:hypothetical protein [Pseudomonas extremaustralis]EZI27488.1 hypothetical protein PE143B_0116500 [Pseudomonas extremaustralis 14-3 substr. 14-3b]MDF3136439.1 hypothetical protein [Pseudomonas extremaustralis]TWS02267.1 hypothetical protein FIV36_20995 [Pseudomonas extremaustralis]SDE90514.1 hypothetical protein SAMN05216591_1338 [Pseudomonas extremaustralis]
MNDESMLPGSPRFGHEGAVIWLTGLSASLQPQLRLETARESLEASVATLLGYVLEKIPRPLKAD